MMRNHQRLFLYFWRKKIAALQNNRSLTAKNNSKTERKKEIRKLSQNFMRHTHAHTESGRGSERRTIITHKSLHEKHARTRYDHPFMVITHRRIYYYNNDFERFHINGPQIFSLVLFLPQLGLWLLLLLAYACEKFSNFVVILWMCVRLDEWMEVCGGGVIGGHKQARPLWCVCDWLKYAHSWVGHTTTRSP